MELGKATISSENNLCLISIYSKQIAALYKILLEKIYFYNLSINILNYHEFSKESNLSFLISHNYINDISKILDELKFIYLDCTIKITKKTSFITIHDSVINTNKVLNFYNILSNLEVSIYYYNLKNNKFTICISNNYYCSVMKLIYSYF